MGLPSFLLQIVDTETGTVVQLPSGGVLEADLIRACTEAAVTRGVGLFKIEAQVRRAIERGFREVLSSLKKPLRNIA